MPDSDSDELNLRVARLEVKVDSILEYLKEDRESMRERFQDHELRLRRGEELGDPKEVLNGINARLDELDKRADKTDKWIHALPVGIVVTFIVAVGSLVSYATGITP